MALVRAAVWALGLVAFGCGARDGLLGVGPTGSPHSGGNGGNAGATGGSETGSEPDAANTPPSGLKTANKIDLLFMIDNSASMADKQKILQLAVPDLVHRLLNPICVSETSGAPGDTPNDPNAECGPGYRREFKPIRDLHIGVITSSIGSFGANTCESDEGLNDHGRLLGARPRALDLGLATAPDGLPGFLSWSALAGGADLDGLTDTLAELIPRAGELGCGFEASLEAWYRFLIDPVPPEQLTIVDCGNGNPCATPTGQDSALLTQRGQFLRPDSLVAIVMLTDENDCSMQNTGQLFYAARSEITLPRAASVCASNPNDSCCTNCGAAPPAGCPMDPICAGPGYDSVEDPLNLRCYAQKQRFGIDFLYPTARYVNALTQDTLCPERADLSVDRDCPRSYPNPLFRDLSGRGRPVRDPSLVVLAGIVGVPWQDIAASADAQGRPVAPNDIVYLSAARMRELGTWDVILGDPTASPPRYAIDPLMIESIDPRPGNVYASGEPLSVTFSNAINGHEWLPLNREDLQYACIFSLPQGDVRDCAVYAPDDPRGCDCRPERDPEGTQNPVCQQRASGPFGNTQYAAKAYPGLRQLQVLKDLGDNAVVASLCARNVVDPLLPDYGYRPAVRSLVEAMGPWLER